MNVIVIPKATFMKGRKITGVVNFDFFGADNAPPALSLHGSQCSQ
jgi:hypothetical protein